VAQKEPPFLSL